MLNSLIKFFSAFALIVLLAIVGHQLYIGNLQRDYQDLKPIIAEQTRRAIFTERELDEMKQVHSAAMLSVLRYKLLYTDKPPTVTQDPDGTIHIDRLDPGESVEIPLGIVLLTKEEAYESGMLLWSSSPYIGEQPEHFIHGGCLMTIEQYFDEFGKYPDKERVF